MCSNRKGFLIEDLGYRVKANFFIFGRFLERFF